MVEYKIISVAILFIIAYFILSFFIPVGKGTFYMVLAFSIVLAASAFLPYRWSKVVREVAYLLLFIGLLLAEMKAVSKFATRTEVNYQTCKNYVFPSASSGNAPLDIINYVSCILVGYYSPSYGTGWATFFLFYIILPFIFVWVLMYGLMSGMGMEYWFGDFGGTATKILSLIIALYAGRVMLGGVLLDLAGYGAWGLAGVFIAIFIVSGLRHMLESWYRIEEMGEETREAIKAEMEVSRAYARGVGAIIDEAKRAAGTDLYAAKVELARLRDTPLYKLLPEAEKNLLNDMIDRAVGAGSVYQFQKEVKIIEKYIKRVLAKLRPK